MNSKGYTLVEVLVVIVILGILAGIAGVSVTGIIERAREDVCQVNVSELERSYEWHLEYEGIEHSNLAFLQFLNEYAQEICPLDGEIRYVNGRVECSLHPYDDEGDDTESDDGVPYL